MSRKWIESNMKHDDKLTTETLMREPGIKEYLNSLPVSKRDKLIGEAVDAGNLTEDLEIFKKLDNSQPWLDTVSKETKKGGRKRRTKRRSKKQRKTRKYMRK